MGPTHFWKPHNDSSPEHIKQDEIWRHLSQKAVKKHQHQRNGWSDHDAVHQITQIKIFLTVVAHGDSRKSNKETYTELTERRLKPDGAVHM